MKTLSSLSGIVELPAYIVCYFMMENPKLGRQKSTAIFNAGLAGACILTTIARGENAKKLSFDWLTRKY